METKLGMFKVTMDDNGLKFEGSEDSIPGDQYAGQSTKNGLWLQRDTAIKLYHFLSEYNALNPQPKINEAFESGIAYDSPDGRVVIKDKKKKNLTVTVGGQNNTGKSRLLALIKNFLKEKGFEIEFEGDTDHPTEKAFDNYTDKYMRIIGDKYAASPEYVLDTKITIKEVQMPTTTQSFKKIDYKDKAYIEKRKILRQLSIKDEIRNFLDIITDDVSEYGFLNGLSGDQQILINKVIDTRSHTFWNLIRSFLVDGYLAFEVIFNEKSKPIGLKILDTVTLMTVVTKDETDSNGELPWHWVQYHDNEKLRRVLTRDQIIYLSYSDINDSNTSYVEEIKESYERLKMVESSLFVKTGGIQMTEVGTMQSIQWLSKNLNKVSRIPDSMLEFGTKSNNITYQRFINRIGGIFKNEMINKLIK